VKTHQPLDPEIWLDRHRDYLFRYARLRLRSPELAEDMVQETFLAALHARSNFAGRSSERTWLIGILKHKIVDHIRRSSREFPTEDVEFSGHQREAFFDTTGRLKAVSSEWSADPRKVLERREFWKTLQNCLAQLPPRTFYAFLLREINGLSVEETCKVLNISTTNLRAMLCRARRHLRLCLKTERFELRVRGN